MSNVDTNPMVLIHRVIRREIGSLPALIRGADGNPGRAARIAAHAGEMLEFLHVHHSGEDELLWPVLRPRVPADADLIDRLESEHQEVAATVKDVQSDLPDWGRTADPATGERMAGRLDALLPLLKDHLDQEEKLLLPLVAPNLSQEEWDALGKHGFAAIPGKRRLVILGHILEEADPDEQRRFKHHVPAPARLAFSLIGHRQYAREVAAIRS